MWVQSLGQEDPLKLEMATHSSILAWRNPMDRRASRATVHGYSRATVHGSSQATVHGYSQATVHGVAKSPA